jgi:hypothetical protein
MKCLILILIVLLPVSAIAEKFGYETQGGFAQEIEDKILGRVDSSDYDGTLDSITAYFTITDGTSHNIHCAVFRYSDTVLIDSSEEKSIGSDGWHTFDLKLDGQILKNTAYVIAAQAKPEAGSSLRLMFNLSPTTNEWAFDNAETYGAWDDPWSGMTNAWSYPVSIYAWYTPTAAAGPPRAIHSVDGAAVFHSIAGTSVLHGP